MLGVSVHEQRAIEIVRELNSSEKESTSTPIPVAQNSARQGDVCFRRVGDSLSRGPATPDAGIIVAAGKNGEHRVVAPSLTMITQSPEQSPANDGPITVMDLPEGGVVVHTDLPSARHKPFTLSPGQWRINHLRELVGSEIARVED